jgi:hypothetical protein
MTIETDAPEAMRSLSASDGRRRFEMHLLLLFGGTDAGGIIITPDGKIIHVPGWNPEQLVELSHAVNILREAAQLKTPRLSEAVTSSVIGFVQKELGSHLSEGGVAIAG